MRISVVIPALDEAGLIGNAIKSASIGAFEVLVVDGGSADATVSIAEASGARAVKSGKGRGRQMDAGAREARGDALLFLHADSALPTGWDKAVKRALSERGVVGGAFSLSMDGEAALLRLIELGVNARSRLFSPYGDQAVFALRTALAKAGGFKSLPLMEDVDCVRRLRRLGKVVLLDEKVKTSPRKWLKSGKADLAAALKMAIVNWALVGLYFAGWRPERLYRLYYGKDP